MDYDHSQTHLRLGRVLQQQNLSFWQRFLSTNDPLLQQADLERERLLQRPSRAVRYRGDLIYKVGEQIIEERSVLMGAKVFGYSFFSGFIFASFLSTPVGCVMHSLRPANMASESVMGDMLYSGLRVGVRNGAAYGSMLAVFRITNYLLGGAWSCHGCVMRGREGGIVCGVVAAALVSLAGAARVFVS
jgi:hypothetical protein